MDSNSIQPPHIPITVFTGFLGAGKTSIILSLLPLLPKDYKVVLLKNEFGDVQVDSQLAKQSSLAAVSEILNGCMCCVLVGQMETALLEIRDKYRPDRIIIECSGSAFPATLAFQIRELERQTNNDLRLDAIVTVIDAENFTGYEDTSPTAKMQASYSDIILINKHEHVDEHALDILIDNLNTLNLDTPKIKCNGRHGVDPNVLFGIDSKLFKNSIPQGIEDHHDEVKTLTAYRGFLPTCHSHEHHDREACISRTEVDVDRRMLESALASLNKESVWRVKGFVRLDSAIWILNWAFGRYDLTLSKGDISFMRDASIRLTIMGDKYELDRKPIPVAVKKFCADLQAQVM
ncbi:CobW/HypB/UreG, nucleotide-binding domain-containing protein [Suillus clintonianus]|uniref:CobW/HypB/UreG, nucleotide-binding domain-containing protein n=1 Tax=Suillus clintonianus TaxID=1904413 RepID=UPI001B872C08|nr:CobW/HypB/UreG, nucleotide-binding domain-containing protein [Suillus clintonianus]KAG2145252.1 CobW/HypB/UreG, nucleotide-binding domain-containing protein [Suillus clintonianus]